jgi:hypothetical protein
MLRLLSLCVAFAIFAHSTHASPPQLDLRLSKGFGSRGYNSVRVSSISNDAETVKPDDFFAYAAPFQHRWTNMTLRSALLHNLPPGQSLVATPLGNFTMRLPEQGAGVYPKHNPKPITKSGRRCQGSNHGRSLLYKRIFSPLHLRHSCGPHSQCRRAIL